MLLTILTAGLLLLCVVAIAYYALCAASVRAFFREARPADPAFAPPVTILKPVKGIDPGAYENFASFLEQDYPCYQVLFGTMEPDDPALETIDRLRADYPERDIGVVVCQDALGANRKVSNLRNMERHARHSVLLISDADMRVGRDYLRRVVQPLGDPGTGMVTCPYRGRGAHTAGALLEALGIGADFIPSAILAARLEGASFAFGATIAFPRPLLSAIGGWEALADYLADDFELGHRAAAAGYRVCLSDYVVDSMLPEAGLREMLRHRLRWARTVRACRPAGYAGTFVTFGVVHALLLLVAAGPAWWAWTALGVVVGSRMATALWIARWLRDEYVTRFFWLVPAADLVSFGVWCGSFAGSRVNWRGFEYRLRPGGKLEAA